MRDARRRVDHEERGIGAVDRFQRADEPVVLGGLVDPASGGASPRCRRTGSRRPRSRPACRCCRGSCPGRSCTTLRSSPTSRLNSVDLPTLGRPTIATANASGSGSGAISGSGGSASTTASRRSPLPRPCSADHREGIAEAEPGEDPDVGRATFVVDLVHRDEHRRLGVAEHAGDLVVLLGDADDAVDHEDDDVGVAHRALGLAAHLLRQRDGIGGGDAVGQPSAGVDHGERRGRSSRRRAPCGHA